MSDESVDEQKSAYLPFIDWMKFIGMAMIVYGHAPGGWLWRPTDPFNVKQIGVVCFIFATGISLARETRPAFRVLFTRLFEMYAVGILFSIVLSTVNFFLIDDFNLSNYMPYVLGVNVFVNYFPANPTTWYIGMYLHLLLVWVVFLQRFKIRFWMIALSALAEIPIRAFLMEHAGDYIAYMMVSNWITIAMVGLWVGQSEIRCRVEVAKAIAIATAIVALMLLWPHLLGVLSIDVGYYSFPYMRVSIAGGGESLLATSTAVTFLYLMYLFLFYQCGFRLPECAFVKLCARNTVFVFVVHLPLVWAFQDPFYAAIDSVLIRTILSLLGYYFLLVLVSEFLFFRLRLLDGLRHLSERVMGYILGKLKIAF